MILNTSSEQPILARIHHLNFHPPLPCTLPLLLTPYVSFPTLSILGTYLNEENCNKQSFLADAQRVFLIKVITVVHISVHSVTAF